MLFSPPPKKQQKQVTKKHFKNERTYRDGMPKKQPNKVGMTPQYSYGLSSLYLLPFFQPHTHTHTHAPRGGHSHRLYSHNCDHSRSAVNGQSRSKGCSQRSRRVQNRAVCGKSALRIAAKRQIWVGLRVRSKV